ncbi:hypothetical protein [Microcoleus sp. herbarium2]|uniref:hypothetical protein n=1 Tax=Microcoleus sp. herbarium2 TaxID=3055433 RepID=UPI002FD2F9C2
MAEYTGAARILSSYLSQENGSERDSTPDNYGIDIFVDDFEDEFPMPDSADIEGWVPESRRANSNRPWGRNFGARPKVHEVNQPLKAQERGWRLVDLHPNRDHKEEYYRLAGTPAELRILLQIARVTREITGRHINFEEWFELWENGFPGFRENRIITNFSLTGKDPWRGKPENKPKFKEWTTPQQRLDYGFRVIEYWRVRSAESDSIVLAGTDLQLINHVIQIEYEGGGAGANKSLNRTWPLLKGQPEIKLYFLGEGKASGEISFRIMDRSDDPKSPLPSIGKADLAKYARLIKDNFALPELFTWQKGKEVVSYRNRWQGFEGWYLSRNQAAGRALIQRMLAVAGHSLDEASLRFTSAPEAAFPANAPDITVLGEVIGQPSERPVVDVKFYRAEIKLSKLRTPIYLNERARIVYE